MSKDRVTQYPKKIETVERFPVLTTRKAVRGFLGLDDYYYRFIANFTEVAHPLS